jgi:hypothetical protein
VSVRSQVPDVSIRAWTNSPSADIAVALCSSRPPLFVFAEISREPFIANKADVEYARGLLGAGLQGSKTDLLSIFADLRAFSASANLAAQTTQKIEPELFQEVLISVNYRLLLFESTGIGRDGDFEVLRLAMLAFSASVFLQTACHEMIFDIVNHKLMSIKSTVQYGNNVLPGVVSLWIHFMLALISLKTPIHDCALESFSDLVRKSNIATWPDLRTMLKRMLWINALHDRAGEQIFEQVLLRVTSGNHLSRLSCNAIMRDDIRSSRSKTAVASEHGPELS